MGIKVIKRDGTIESYSEQKISDSIMGAALAVGGDDYDLADELAEKITDILESNGVERIYSSDISKSVKKLLMEEGHSTTAEQYIIYSNEREKQRDMDSELMRSYEDITFSSDEADSDVKKENANIDSNTAMGTMLKYGSEGAKKFNSMYLMSPNIARAHKNGDIHIHDLDFLSLTETCCQIPLDKLFEHGFNTGHGYLRSPGNIRTASALAAIAIQSNQNDQHGGQSIPMFDYYLAPYVALTYAKSIAQVAKYKLDLKTEIYEELKFNLVEYQKEHKLIMSDDKKPDLLNIMIELFETNKIKVSLRRLNKILRDAYEMTYNETFQAMEAFIHNLNTMHCLPASEKIWVLDVETNEFKSITMEELNDTFKPKKYKVISLNKETGKAEFKFITASQRMDNHRNIVELTNQFGMSVKVTDNHKVMTLDGAEITEKLPDDILYTISPRGIKIPAGKYDIDLVDYKCSNEVIKKDHILVNENLAKLLSVLLSSSGKLSWTNDYIELTCLHFDAKYVEELVKNVFWEDVVITKYNENDGRLVLLLGKTIIKFLKDITDCFTKIPNCIYRNGESVMRAFLSDCDNFTSYNRDLRNQIRLLATSCKEQTHCTTTFKVLGELIDKKITNTNEFTEVMDCNNNSELDKFNNIEVKRVTSRHKSNSDNEYVYDISVQDNENFLTYECIYVHNSRAGAQVPFSSINYGTDTSIEGRIVMETVLKTTWDGLGNGEIPIFPIQIYKLKKGVSFGDGAPNNDLYELACKVSAKRLYPNFVNLDAPYNSELYIEGRPETEMATMGCVEGNETVLCRINGDVVYKNFKDTWELLTNIFSDNIKPYSILTEYIDLEKENVEVYDSYSGGFVKVKKLIRNRIEDKSTWRKLLFRNSNNEVNTFYATHDHPLPVDGIRTFVEDMKFGNIVPGSLCYYKSTHGIELDDKVEISELYALVEISNIDSSDYLDNIDFNFSYDMETESDRLDISFLQSHNCRTRVGKNVYDPDKSVVPGRGNLSFTSINLPRIAILSNGDIDKFYKLLDDRMELVHTQLLERFELQCKKHPKNYPFLMGQGCWIGSDRLGPNDDIKSVLRNGSLTIGFIGLAETLVALTGKHHGESKESQKLGLEIISHMRELADVWSEEEKMNYTIIGTPAEGLSGRFLRIDKEKFGNIPGVTDKEYYTNSNHVPVSFPISAYKKVEIEAPYHALLNGGHILYIEMDGDPLRNLKAFKKLVEYMHDSNAGYMAINHKLDRDPCCGYVGIIDDVCPRCGRKEFEPMSLEVWNKIKGYANVGNADTLGYHGDPFEEEDRIPNSI